MTTRDKYIVYLRYTPCGAYITRTRTREEVTRKEPEMTEKEIERRMCEMVRKHGGLTYKLVGLVNGLPDRLLIAPGGKIIFVELKTGKGRLSKIQIFRINEIKHMGAYVRVIYGYEDMVQFIEEVFQNGES